LAFFPGGDYIFFMRALLLFLAAPFLLAAAPLPEPVADSLPAPVRDHLAEAEKELLKTDCLFLAHLYDPKEARTTPLTLCVSTQPEQRGIFVAHGCVGVLMEPRSKLKSPFYGKDGHWGAEGKCSGEQMLRLLDKKETLTTVNPVTSFRTKRKEGMKLRLLRDDLGIGGKFRALTDPSKN
jgi:hypothetical protein